MRRSLRRLFLAAFVCVILAAVGVYWLTAWSNTPDYDGRRSVFIPRHASFDAVTDSLVNAGVVDNANSFVLFATATGWGDQVKAGHYSIPAGLSNKELLSILRRGLQEPVKVVIPPGSRKEVVAAVVAKNMEFSARDFLSALGDTTLASELGTDTTNLFGFMLPETYSFYWLTDAPTVVRKVKEYFDAFYAKEYSGKPLGIELSPEEVVNVASIVEWESGHDEERPAIAGVYLNRLRDRWRLQADPTVQYAILEAEGSKRRLFFRDYDIDHPYNTYKYSGLPPGPVTNPSPSAIRAVLHPDTHGYYYFVANGDGTHAFSRTLREHNAAASRFYAIQRARRASGN